MEHVAGVLRDLRTGANDLGRLPSPSEPTSIAESVRDVRPRLGELGESVPSMSICCFRDLNKILYLILI